MTDRRTRSIEGIAMTMLETERLTIRNFRNNDWEALHEMIVQYVSSGLAALEPHQWPTSSEEIKKITEWFASGDSYFAICLKDTGRFIGFVCLNPEQKKEREFNLGYTFNFDYHGKGYATEACRAVLSHAFDKLGAQRVVTGTHPANTASVRLLERLGFRRTSESPGWELSRDEWMEKSGHTGYTPG